MKKMLKITLGGKDFMADLCADEAPQTVAAFEEAGPFTSIVFAANICSNEITWNTPVAEEDLPGFTEEADKVWGCQGGLVSCAIVEVQE